ncbi:MAG: anti-sigma factor antagonist [bacterium]|nr:anti-sigma factor antagonist [bacterium]
MDFLYESKKGKLRIFAPEEIDECTASKLRVEADELIDLYQVRCIIFDFAKTEFMDSSGIGMLIGRSRKMGYSGGSVEAVNLNPRVQKIFELSGLKKLISVVKEDNL